MICALSGVLAGLAGASFAALSFSGSPASALDWELSTIAALVVGVTLLTGGTGSFGGTITGVLLLPLIVIVHNVERGQGAFQAQFVLGRRCLWRVLVDRCGLPESPGTTPRSPWLADASFVQSYRKSIVTNVIPNLENFNSSGIGDLQEVRVKIVGTDQSFAISMPTDFDRLLDLAQDDPEQNLPYWAELWPSGIALAAHIVSYPGDLRGIQAIELGCGLGVTAIAAMRRGIRLVATDYAPEALALCAMNCAANDVPAPTLRHLNWRKPDPDFLTVTMESFPLLLAADALYEERDIEPLFRLVQTTLSADGELWLAEPGRRPAARFVERISALGWRSSKTSYDGPWPDPEDNRKGVVVTVHRITRPF